VPEEDPAEVELAWMEELVRRDQEIKDGTAELLEWSEVRAQFHERAASYRARRR